MKQWLKTLAKHPFILRLLARIAAWYIGFVFRTTRWQKLGWEYPQHYWRNHKPFITCFWHNRLLMACFAWEGPHMFHMLISAHADGQLIANTVSHYNIKTIAGSKSKGGTTALRTMLKILKAGETIGITPDGPRGPRFKASRGIVTIAHLSGLDILPVTYSTSRRWVFQSWDRFILALPFSRGVLAWGKPISLKDFPTDGTDNLETVAEVVEKRLQELCDRADALCGYPPLR